MRALLLIDIQIDFLPGGALPVPDGHAIVPEVNHYMTAFPLIVATQDWHPADHQSFASQHSGKNEFDRIELGGISQVLWPDHCIQGSRGAALSPTLHQEPIAAIFRKGMDKNIDSYSGFYDNGHVNSTGLLGFLKDKKVTELVLVGLAGDYCVFHTAMDALASGFRTSLILSGIRSIQDADFESCVLTLQKQGAHIFQTFQDLLVQP